MTFIQVQIMQQQNHMFLCTITLIFPLSIFNLYCIVYFSIITLFYYISCVSLYFVNINFIVKYIYYIVIIIISKIIFLNYIANWLKSNNITDTNV